MNDVVVEKPIIASEKPVRDPTMELQIGDLAEMARGAPPPPPKASPPPKRPPPLPPSRGTPPPLATIDWDAAWLAAAPALDRVRGAARRRRPVGRDRRGAARRRRAWRQPERRSPRRGRADVGARRGQARSRVRGAAVRVPRARRVAGDPCARSTTSRGVTAPRTRSSTCSTTRQTSPAPRNK